MWILGSEDALKILSDEETLYVDTLSFKTLSFSDKSLATARGLANICMTPNNSKHENKIAGIYPVFAYASPFLRRPKLRRKSGRLS
jgi:hypothetical protein